MQGRRALLIAPQPFFSYRGTPLRVRQMASVLGEAGWLVDIATYGIGEDVDIPGVTIKRAASFPGIRKIPVGFSWKKILLDALLALKTWRLISTNRYQIVHAVEESIYFALPATMLAKVPVIYDLNSSISHQLAYTGILKNKALLRMARSLQAAALSKSNAAITVGRALTDEGVRSLNAQVPVTEIEDCPSEESYDSVDPATVADVRERFGLKAGPVIVYTGNLAEYQGVDLLFNAMPVVLAKCPNAQLLMVGGGTKEIALARAYLWDNEIDDAVVFAGSQPPEAMKEFMAVADVLVSPRRGGQNTPLKIYDYMSSGTPIVATDLPTHRHVLDESTAVLCAPTPEKLGSAIGDVLADPAKYTELSIAALERVRTRYSRNVFAGKLLSLYSRTATYIKPSVQNNKVSSAATARSRG